jgi:MFS family permease
MSAPQPASTAPLPWYRTITRAQWNVLFAAMLGWMLDAMDFAIYLMAMTTLQSKEEFDFDNSIAGLLATVTLLASAVGGLIFGVVADRIGRTRALMATILIFSFCSLMTATATELWHLMLWRILLGLGMGGEWASGAVLVSETRPKEHRGKAIGIMQSGWALGYILAALLSAVLLPLGWRWLFVAGVLPAFFILWVRRSVHEPPVWTRRQQAAETAGNPFAVIFSRQLRYRTIMATLLATFVMFGYWGVFTWLPGFLNKPITEGGAALDTTAVSQWIITMQLGAFFGYLTFGFICDRVGRRPAFILFMIAAAIIVPVYGQLAPYPTALLLLGPLLGFFGHGYFSVFGAMLAELFPTRVRATGQGLTYNVGRGLGALAPFIIGALATIEGVGIGLALGVTSAFFLAGAVLILLVPETRGKELED